MQSTSWKTLDWKKHNLDSSLCFIQPTMSHDVLCILVKQTGWQYTALTYSFPDLEPVCCSMSSSNCCFLTYIQISQEAGQVVSYSHLFKNFPQFIMIHTVKGFGIVNKAEMFFWNSLAFSMIQRMLSIWFLVPLPFLNPAWIPGLSWFMYCWSLAWRILTITLPAGEMSAIVQWFENSLSLPFGVGMKTDLFQCVHCWVFQTFWHI